MDINLACMGWFETNWQVKQKIRQTQMMWKRFYAFIKLWMLVLFVVFLVRISQTITFLSQVLVEIVNCCFFHSHCTLTVIHYNKTIWNHPFFASSSLRITIPVRLRSNTSFVWFFLLFSGLLPQFHYEVIFALRCESTINRTKKKYAQYSSDFLNAILEVEKCQHQLKQFVCSSSTWS